MKIQVSAPGHSASLEVSPEDLAAFEHFFSFKTPGFVKDGVGMWNDNMRLKRIANFLRITREAEELRKKYNLKTAPLPLKDEVTFIETSSLEEEPTIQTMWAHLLANTSSNKVKSDVTLMSTLKEFSKTEAIILQYYYSVAQSRPGIKYPTLYIYTLREKIENETDNPEMIFDKLVRLRLLKEPVKRVAILPTNINGNMMLRQTGLGLHTGRNEASEKIVKYLQDDKRHTSEASNSLQLTSLGYTLLIACNSPEDIK
jgi:hypothetical protein